MAQSFTRKWRLFADTSGLAGMEFALATTVLVVGLLNGLEVAQWSMQKMELNNAVHSATMAVWSACDIHHVPAMTNCSTAMNTAITNGLQSTSLGTHVTLDTATEGYYCAGGGVLTKVAAYDATTVPSDCSSVSNDKSHAPGDYVVVKANYTYTPLFGSSLTVGNTLPTALTSTGYIRLK